MASIRSGCCKLLQRTQHPQVSKITLNVTCMLNSQHFKIIQLNILISAFVAVILSSQFFLTWSVRNFALTKLFWTEE